MLLSYPDPLLRDDVVTIRPWQADDVGCIAAAATDPRIPQGTTVPETPTPSNGVAFIHRQLRRRITGDGLSQAIALPGTDVAVGLAYLGLRPAAGVVEIGYWLIPAARGHGLAAHAVRLVTTWALTSAGCSRVEALVHLDNEASHRTLIAAGYTREGVLRDRFAVGAARTDAVIYSRIRSDL